MRPFKVRLLPKVAATVAISTLLLAATPIEATRPVGFRVFCDPSTGEVVADDELNENGRIAMSGLFPGPGTAEVWIDENCPERRCHAGGQCASARPDPAAAADGWFVLCNRRSGDVGLVEVSSLPGFTVMAGPYATQEEADAWAVGSCPGWRCDSTGACLSTARQTTGGSVATTAPSVHTGRAASGVLVRIVAPGSHGEAAGFRTGDRLISINGVPATSPEQVMQLVAAAQLGTWLEFRVQRNRQPLILGALRTVEPLGLKLVPTTADTREAFGPATGSSDGWVAGTVETTTGDPRSLPSAGSGGGWAVGELNTVAGTAGGGDHGPPSNVVGPRQAKPDVSRLAAAAKVAAEACAFPAALANADHMANVDSANPWLTSNHEKLRQLASRQKATEQAVWQASRALADEDLKDARKITYQAADTAVSCQYEAVSTLLDRIDQVIAHRKAEKSAASRRAVGALLPGLLALNQAVTSGKYGGSTTALPSTGGTTNSAMAAVGAAIGGPPDPCSFDYSYPSVWSTEPICACNGYRYDPLQLRCVR